MNHDIFYFSGSGNSLYISRALDAAVPGRIRAIGALDLSKSVSSDADMVGLVFPVYFMDCPDIVAAFIDRLEVKPDAYVYCIASCGAMAGNTLANTARRLSKRGIPTAAQFLIFLPDNSIAFPTPDEKIAPMLESGKRAVADAVTAIREKRISKPFRRSIAAAFLTAISKPVIIRCGGFGIFELDAAKCTKCGICEKICPVQNITRPEGTPTFGTRCASCLACIHWCPSQAITMPKQKRRSGFQYTNPEISCTDLIIANGNRP